MVGRQSPALQIFGWAQPLSPVVVAAQGQPPRPALQAHHKVVAHGLAYRDRRGQRFFDNRLLPKRTQTSVYGGDEVRQLTCVDFVISQIAPDNFWVSSGLTFSVSMAVSRVLF